VNVAAQTLRTQEDVGYLLVDVDQEVSLEALAALAALPETIRARLLS
jgi:D-3-phosphoglycerate dehydrogenase